MHNTRVKQSSHVFIPSYDSMQFHAILHAALPCCLWKLQRTRRSVKVKSFYLFYFVYALLYSILMYITWGCPFKDHIAKSRWIYYKILWDVQMERCSCTWVVYSVLLRSLKCKDRLTERLHGTVTNISKQGNSFKKG